MNHRGRTLVELTVVLAIVAFLVGLGQAFVSATTRHRGNAVRVELAAEFRAARHIAMIRRQRIRVVLAPDVAHVRTELGDGSQTLLRRYDFSAKDIQIEHSSNGNVITFYPSGRTATPTTITLRTAAGERWQMTVSLTGRVTLL